MRAWVHVYTHTQLEPFSLHTQWEPFPFLFSTEELILSFVKSNVFFFFFEGSAHSEGIEPATLVLISTML